MNNYAVIIFNDNLSYSLKNVLMDWQNRTFSASDIQKFIYWAFEIKD